MKTKRCRMCKSTDITPFLNMGEQPLVNSLLTKEELKLPEESYKLVVSYCNDCGLVQIVNPIAATKIYQDVDYLYFSSDMPGLRDYFEEYIIKSVLKYLRDDDLVVEIGSNDGILLRLLQNNKWKVENNVYEMSEKWRVLGVDPATNVVLRALKKGIPTIPAFFTENVAKKIEKEWGKAKVMIGNNCIAHLNDLDDLMKGVDALLTDDGVFIIEANYWGGMVDNTNYSLIYHDHFSYFTFTVWDAFLSKFGFELIDAIVTPAQGGSMRMTIAREGAHKCSDNVEKCIKAEFDRDLDSLQTCKRFAKSVKQSAKKLNKLVKQIVDDDGTIAGYGAAAKGFTILNMSELGQDDLVCCIDDSPAKQNMYVPLNHIQILSRKDAEELEFNHILILPWNYRDTIMNKEVEFKKRGGKFIIPVGDIGVI